MALKQQALWGSVFIGFFFMLFIIAEGWPSGHNAKSISPLLLLVTLSGAVISVIIRWAILPKKESIQELFVTMLIGLALADGTGIMGIFLIGSDFPETQQIVFLTSALAMLQYIPTYASSAKLADKDVQ